MKFINKPRNRTQDVRNLVAIQDMENLETHLT
jgi:hypothetical protein